MLEKNSLFYRMKLRTLSGSSQWMGLFLLGAMVLCARPSSAQEVIGVQRCRSCHEFEYQKWLSGPHAGSKKALSANQLTDPKCNTCHSLKINEEAERASVGCESCHGPGQYYHSKYVMKDSELARAVGLIVPNQAQCEQCHTAGAPSVVPFDFKKMWAKIDHSAETREVWLRARSTDPTR